MRGVAPKRIKIPRTGSPPSAERPRAQETEPRTQNEPARTSPINATRARGGTGSPRGPCRPPRPLARIEKRPPRARRPALPQPGAAVLSAKAGLTAGFGMGPGDPRLCGRARGGRSPAAQMYSSLPGPLSGATLAAAWRARIEDAHRARCFNRGCEELGLLVPLG